MQQQTDKRRNTSILPLVLAAFAGATLAIACERPDSRVSARVGADGERARQATSAGAPRVDAARKAPEPSPSRDTLTDTVITGRIKTAILTDPGMAGADVSVNTDHGVVTLVGNVKSYEQTGIASAHAQREDGVMRVDNHLSVNPQ
jgi:hyperosmotically inducible periplasmic protein